MSNWLADRTGIHMNLRPLAPIAGAVLGNLILPGIGGAALGAGLGRFADGVGNNEGFGHAAKAGLITGGATYAGGKGFEALRGAFAPGSTPQFGAGSNVTGANIAPGGTEIGSESGLMAPTTTPAASPGGGFSFGNAANAVGSFAKNNPLAISGGLQGLGSIASSGANNDLMHAQARHLTSADDASDYELQRKKAQDATLEPIRQALAGQLSALRANKYGIAANPYLTG